MRVGGIQGQALKGPMCLAEGEIPTSGCKAEQFHRPHAHGTLGGHPAARPPNLTSQGVEGVRFC